MFWSVQNWVNSSYFVYKHMQSFINQQKHSANLKV